MKIKIKRKTYIITSIFLIFFLTLFLFNIYSKKNSKKINDVVEKKVKEKLYTSIFSELVSDFNFEKIIDLYFNDQREILYVDYDLDKTYTMLKKIVPKIQSAMGSNFIMKVPFFIGSESPFFSSVGPKINIKINYMDSILSNIKTNIKPYGINNALIEIYLSLNFEVKIITPVNENICKVNYDFLIDSKVINGRIPEYYGNYIASSSSVFDIPIN